MILAVAGAALGFLLAGPVGAAVGALAGAALYVGGPGVAVVALLLALLLAAAG